METNEDRRVSDRHLYAAPIVFSYFNKDQVFKAHIYNYCDVGMGFESDFFLKPGTTICIKVNNFHPKKSCAELTYGLRTVTLADVQWCDEEIDADNYSYAVGVKYYAPCY